MLRWTIITFIITSCTFLQAQQSIELSYSPEFRKNITEKTIYYKVAQSIVPIRIQQYGERSDIVFINLHDDELTSVEAARKLLIEQGGILIEIENNLQRNILFRFGDHYYHVDPNRIFSKEGIKKSMEELGRSSLHAADEVWKFSQRILQLIPETAKCLIALHNNTPDFFSVLEYSAGNKRSVDTKKIYITPGQDADDFFLTTDNKLYEQLADKGFNIVLQDNKNCTEDGSLSVYCGKNKIRYINCETENGKTEQYFLMIQSIIHLIDD